MSQERHTPGPWRAEFSLPDEIYSVHAAPLDTRGIKASIDTRIGRDGYETVFDLDPPESGWQGIPVDMQHANALLIAAAPALLAELETIANADPSKWDEEVRGQFQQWAQNRARAAIAKATGGAA